MATSKKQSTTVITDGIALNTLIKSIGGRGKLLDRDIHRAAVSALWHGFQHKSTAHAEMLLGAMPQVSRKNALRAWLLDMGCFMVKDDGKTLGINKEVHAAGFKLEQEAIDTPFWKYTAEPEVLAQVDAMELVRKLVTKLTKAKESGKLDAASETVLEKLAKVAPALEVDSAK